MTDTVKRSRDFPSPHPGVILRDEIMEPEGMTVSHLANAMGVAKATVSRFINQKSAATAELAARLELSVGISAEFWLNLQVKHDLWKARKHSYSAKPARDFKTSASVSV